jgi:UDP-N-acetylglucosamine--N-acetylmuramyl-(pentapeptide) pyrophosphoryl-undecaprenol N-acetylglucosamine transferase
LKILFGAGGTGGHIIPALAIAHELSSRGWKIAFIGNKNSMEQSIIVKHGYAFTPVHVQKIYRRFTLRHIMFPFLFVASICKSLSCIRRYHPDAILCTGGYVSGPVAIAARLLGQKLYFQDGNSFPGLTTRFMSGAAKHVFIASDAARRHLKSADCVLTGNPLLLYEPLDKTGIDWNGLNLHKNTIKLFIIGGSQGSSIINKVIGDCVPELLEQGIELIWQTGKANLQEISEKYSKKPGLHFFGFTDRMSEYYQMADLAIARAGALSIAELEEHRIPTIFIPLPTAAENHQYKNAIIQQQKGLGIVLEQKNLNRQFLLAAIKDIVANRDDFVNKLALLPPNDATRQIADIIERETSKTEER